VDEFIISLQGYPDPTHKVVVYQIFVFDSLVLSACLSKSGNVDEELLNDIGNGLKNENPYCKDLQQLGIHV
jgi:hypothetical protein